MSRTRLEGDQCGFCGLGVAYWGTEHDRGGLPTQPGYAASLVSHDPPLAVPSVGGTPPSPIHAA
jgi:hypothetical protein